MNFSYILAFAGYILFGNCENPIAPIDHKKSITSAKEFIVQNSDNQIVIDNLSLGEVSFSFEDSNERYITAEAPLNDEIFLKTVWEHNIDTFVTLTRPEDNSYPKIAIFRHGISVDVHHLIDMGKKGMIGDFFITPPKTIEGINGVIVLKSYIIKGEEIREIKQIWCYNWEDGTIADDETIKSLISMIEKYHDKKNTLFVNFFLGIGRTRFVVLAAHKKHSKKAVEELSDEYFIKNYNKEVLEKGEILSGFEDKKSEYYSKLKNLDY